MVKQIENDRPLRLNKKNGGENRRARRGGDGHAHIGTHTLLILFAFLAVFPFFWMLLTSFKTYEESIQIPATFFPAQLNLDNYRNILQRFPFGAFYLNTFGTMIVVIAAQMFICSMAAYAFARLRFPGKNALFIGCLSLLMVPGQIFLIPQYDLINRWHLSDSFPALWMPYLYSVFSVFLLRQFFQTLPHELDDAAKIDGCGFWRIYWQILLPQIKPGLTSMVILTGLASWKDLLWPLIVNNSMDKYTLSAGLALLIGEHTTIYPLVMAGSFLAVWPMLLLYFFAQKQFVEGLASSGIKG